MSSLDTIPGPPARSRQRGPHPVEPSAVRGALPAGTPATEPIEARGLPRDAARLLVTGRDAAPAHRTLADLPAVLTPGDVLVVNTSAVLPAALPGRRDSGEEVRVHLSGPDPTAGPHRIDGRRWVVEVRRPDGLGSQPLPHARHGELVALPAGGRLLLRQPLAARPDGGARLWHAELTLPTSVSAYLRAHGAPIRYSDGPTAWPLETYQTVFASHPGSVESPSAARGFTPDLVVRLVAAGIDVVPVLLHTAVSSAEAGETPPPEWHAIGPASAARLTRARRDGRRVVAVGTTVVRAVETAAAPDGTVHPSRGWTDLVIDEHRSLHVVDGLLTGWHDADASHLSLLAAVVGWEAVADATGVAAAAGYRWHELGDAALLLPATRRHAATSERIALATA